MLQIQTHYHGPLAPTARLTLPFELRQKSRLRCQLDDGEEVALLMARGTVLRGGDLLCAEDGRVVQVIAAPEGLSVVATDDALQLARAAYHLGNRHVALQVRPGMLCFLHDHVLDDMLRGLGLPVRFEMLPFEPEGGAYGRHDSTGAHAHPPHKHGHSSDDESHGHGHHHHH
jgi:urease accessory protein